MPKVHYTPSKSGRLMVCPFCNKMILNKSASANYGLSSMQSHLENNHGPETGFVCKICSPPNGAQAQYVFVNLSAASEHLKEKHRNLSPVTNSLLREKFVYPDDARSFSCLKCTQIFLGQSFRTGGIVPHLKTAHGFEAQCQRLMGNAGEDKQLADQGIVSIRCRRCDEDFQEESSLVIHGKICTG